MIRTHTAKDGSRSYGVRLHRGGGRYEWVGTFPTRKAARAAEAEALTTQKQRERPTVDQLVERFLAEYGRKNRTSSLDQARAATRAFLREHEGTLVHLVDRQGAELFARDREWALPVMVSVFNYAVRHELLDRSPFAGLSRKVEGRRDLDPLTPEQIDQLAANARAEHGAVMEAFVRFGAYSGARPGELYAMEWRDIDFDANRISVRRRVYRGELDLPKGKKPRLTALLPEARDALIGLPRTSSLLFPSKTDRRLSGSNVSSHYWPPIRAGFDKTVTPHVLRHFCGHHLYVRLDLPARVVATQLGHSSPRLVEELYGHFKVGALEEIDRVVGDNVVELRGTGGAHG